MKTYYKSILEIKNCTSCFILAEELQGQNSINSNHLIVI